MFEYDFMIRTLLAGFMLSIMIPLIGSVLVNRKTAMLGDALSHTSLAGVAMGLILGFDPVIGAVIVCIISALAIEKIRKKEPKLGDMATAVVMSLGLGIAAILSNFAPGGNSFEAYLFGSISSVSKLDLINICFVFILVITFSFSNYAGLLDMSIDSNMARLAGVKVRTLNIVFTILTAITIALACKIVGALLVASLLVLPVATSLIIARSYNNSLKISIVLGLIYMLAGITISFYTDIKPGGAIVVNAIIGMLIASLIKRLRDRQKA